MPGTISVDVLGFGLGAWWASYLTKPARRLITGLTECAGPQFWRAVSECHFSADRGSAGSAGEAIRRFGDRSAVAGDGRLIWVAAIGGGRLLIWPTAIAVPGLGRDPRFKYSRGIFAYGR